eukprot:3118723-Alexandrium_andersonii.AAC.1
MAPRASVRAESSQSARVAQASCAQALLLRAARGRRIVASVRVAPQQKLKSSERRSVSAWVS